MGSSESTGAVAGTMAKLKRARERLDAKDLPGAMAIYEEVLVAAGDRADVLVVISGDLGSTGHVAEVVELIAPRYDATRHGPATGFNLLQAYIGVRNAPAAQHLLDLLFDLKRPDLEERLFGYSNAISELMLAETEGGPVMAAPQAGTAPAGAAKVGVVSISKPVWFYGLEDLADRILPPKPEGKVRRVAFAQLALPGTRGETDEAVVRPDNELALLAGAIPAWLAEVFTFSTLYAPYTAVAFVEKPDGTRHPMIFGSEWTTENLRNLVDTTSEGLDYVFTGALKQRAGDYELLLRVWEVRKFRERKQFLARWTPATVDAELTRLRDAIGQFMEWKPIPPGQGIAYQPVATPRSWLEAVGASLNLFLAEKGIFPKEWVPPLEPACRALAEAAPTSAIASLTWLTLKQRAQKLSLPLGDGPEPSLKDDPLVSHASGHR